MNIYAAYNFNLTEIVTEIIISYNLISISNLN